MAALYKISARTLRYYEEVGILKSYRKNGSKYREYDRELCERLEVILLLRRLSFSIKIIEELLKGDGVNFSSALQEKIADSAKKVIEARETNNLLRDLAQELAHKPITAINAAEMLREYVYLSKQTERVIKMSLPPHKEKYRVAMGYALAMEVCNENSGDLLRKLKDFRLEMDKNYITFPPIRVYDSEDMAQNQVLIVWNGEEVLRKDFQLENAVTCANEIVGQLKLNCLKYSGIPLKQ